MHSTVIFHTTQDNYYFIDKEKDIVNYCHPLIVLFHNMKKSGVDISTFVNSRQKIKLKNGLSFQKSDIKYYYNKYKYLRQNGLFAPKNSYQRIFSELLPNTIEQQIANLKQLTFEVTDACNLKCKYCGYGEFYEDYDARENKFMEVKVAKELLKYLMTYWNSSLNTSQNKNIFISFYGGEPLMNMPFIKHIIEYISKQTSKHNRFTFSMTTNATLLIKHIDYLVQNNFNLLISLDGNKYNNSYRVNHEGKESFEKIYHDLKIIKTKYPEYYSSRVNFNSVLHNRNSVFEIHNFIKKEFNKTPNIAELNNTGIREEKREIFFNTYRNATESLHQSEDYTYLKEDRFIQLGEVQSVCTFLHQYSGNVFRTYNDLFFNKNEQKRIPTGTCLPFSKRLYLTVNGKILACERIGQQYALGKVSERGVELNFEKIADKYNNYYKKIIGQCSHCYNTEACIQCIFNLEDLENKPVCNGFMNEKNWAVYLNDIISYFEKNPKLYYKIMEDVIIEN